MGKDLRNNATLMRLHKYPKLDGSLWDLKQLQPFFPSLETLFKTNALSNLSDYGVRLIDEIQKIVDETHIQVKGKPV